MITMTYRGFDHRVHTGQLVVNAKVTGQLILVFRKLFAMRYPIREMVPVDVYHGSDFASIQADNTSAFNCRNATGSSSWSEHAYGLAVDLNPCENPYVAADGYEAHKRCRQFTDRNLTYPGLVHDGDPVVSAFASVGWGWGGIWQGARDSSTSPRTAGSPPPVRLPRPAPLVLTLATLVTMCLDETDALSGTRQQPCNGDGAARCHLRGGCPTFRSGVVMSKRVIAVAGLAASLALALGAPGRQRQREGRTAATTPVD